MTTFAALAGGIDTSRPLELYTFTRGFQVFRFVASDAPVTFDGADFVPLAGVERDAIDNKGQKDLTTTITLPVAISFSQAYLRTPPSQRTAALIERIEWAQTNTARRILFQGSVKQPSYQGDATRVAFLCQSDESVVDRLIPLYGFTRQCGHTLYGPGCEVNPAFHQHQGEVTAVSADGLEITVDGLAASGVDTQGGFLRTFAADDFRTVIEQSGDDVQLAYPFFDDPSATTIVAQAGCDRIYESDCSVVFDNAIRFGGWPYPPLKNPFQTGLD